MASACGSRLNDDQLAQGDGVGGGQTATTATTAPDGAGGPMFGTLASPCGPAPAGFDASATFVGAVRPGAAGADDWTTGWTAYPAN